MMKNLVFVLVILAFVLTSCAKAQASVTNPRNKSTVTPTSEVTLIPTIESMSTEVVGQPEGSLTLRQLFAKYGNGPYSWEFITYPNQATTFRALINGKEETIFDDPDVDETDGQFFKNEDGSIDCYGHGALFWVGGAMNDLSADKVEYQVILVFPDLYTAELEFIPSSIMPRIIDDITSWNGTKTTLFVWPWPYTSGIGVVQNLSTNEIYFGDFDLANYQNNEKVEFQQYDEPSTGFVTIEGWSHYSFDISISQDRPDYVKLDKAWQYAEDMAWSLYGHDYYFRDMPVDACQYLSENQKDLNLTKVKDLCGEFYIK